MGVQQAINRVVPEYKLYRCVTPSWDNTARKMQNGIVGLGSNPKLYFTWLKHVVRNFKSYSSEENFIFINAMIGFVALCTLALRALASPTSLGLDRLQNDCERSRSLLHQREMFREERDSRQQR